jgi:glycosyltransferase involved in cell wall biosynthesis
MTVIESMASGTPSIVPDVPGISELAEGTGLTFHRDNLEELSDRAVTLAHDRALRDSLGEACLRRSKEFAGRVIADRFEELYRTVMETHKDRGRR